MSTRSAPPLGSAPSGPAPLLPWDFLAAVRLENALIWQYHEDFVGRLVSPATPFSRAVYFAGAGRVPGEFLRAFRDDSGALVPLSGLFLYPGITYADPERRPSEQDVTACAFSNDCIGWHVASFPSRRWAGYRRGPRLVLGTTLYCPSKGRPMYPHELGAVASSAMLHRYASFRDDQIGLASDSPYRDRSHVAAGGAA